MSRNLPVCLATAALFCVPLAAIAQPPIPTSAQIHSRTYSPYPVLSMAKPIGPICYLEMGGYRMDLSSICGIKSAEGAGAIATSSVGRSSGGGSSAGGPCDRPDQLDSAGNRCGKRAASEKKGGR